MQGDFSFVFLIHQLKIIKQFFPMQIYLSSFGSFKRLIFFKKGSVSSKVNKLAWHSLMFMMSGITPVKKCNLALEWVAGPDQAVSSCTVVLRASSNDQKLASLWSQQRSYLCDVTCRPGWNLFYSLSFDLL